MLVHGFLIASGALTALAGAGAFLAPALVLRVAFALPSGPIVFFVRHWGLLIGLVGALTVWCAFVPAGREAVLGAAALEKAVIVALILAGPIKRTPLMTAAAVADGLFALGYGVVLLHP